MLEGSGRGGGWGGGCADWVGLRFRKHAIGADLGGVCVVFDVVLASTSLAPLRCVCFGDWMGVSWVAGW